MVSVQVSTWTWDLDLTSKFAPFSDTISHSSSPRRVEEEATEM